MRKLSWSWSYLTSCCAQQVELLIHGGYAQPSDVQLSWRGDVCLSQHCLLCQKWPILACLEYIHGTCIDPLAPAEGSTRGQGAFCIIVCAAPVTQSAVTATKGDHVAAPTTRSSHICQQSCQIHRGCQLIQICPSHHSLLCFVLQFRDHGLCNQSAAAAALHHVLFGNDRHDCPSVS